MLKGQSGLIQIDCFYRYLQSPAFGHGIARIDRNIQDRVFQLVAVAGNKYGLFLYVSNNFNALVDSPVQELFYLFEKCVKIDFLKVNRGFSREREQLPRKVGCFCAVGNNILRMSHQERIAFKTHFKQFRMAHDAAEQVVEIMRNAA
jgi:hypothetical protein